MANETNDPLLSNDTQPNREQASYWNEQGGPRWVAMQRDLDAQLEPFGIVVADKLGLVSGERVLDVGCGAGATSLMLAERVRPGQVVGIDISGPLLARARERGATIENLRFEHADAQTFAFSGRSVRRGLLALWGDVFRRPGRSVRQSAHGAAKRRQAGFRLLASDARQSIVHGAARRCTSLLAGAPAAAGARCTWGVRVRRCRSYSRNLGDAPATATSTSPRTTPISCLPAAAISRGQSSWYCRSVHLPARFYRLPKRLTHECVPQFGTRSFRITGPRASRCRQRRGL